MLHPERTWPGGTLAYQRLKTVWKRMAHPSLGMRFMDYLYDFSQSTLPKANKALMAEYMEAMLFPVIESLVDESPDKDSYTITGGSVGGRELQPILLENSSGDSEALVASLLSHYAVVRWVAHNKPIYTVAPELSEALQNTQLRQYPSEMLELPFPALYLELPAGKFEVAGHHGGPPAPAEGVYILQESGLENKTWRMIVASPEEREMTADVEVRNASVWFFSMEFPEGMTVDDSIKYTMKKVATPGYVEHVDIEGDDVEVMRGLEERQLAEFKKNRKPMIELFRYVMNVMIYITSVGADSVMWNASKEYRDLRARALKAKGPKRDALNARLKNVVSMPRILLGKDIVIDRSHINEVGEDGAERTVKVRTYVQGYWNVYHVGPGRTLTVSKLVKPHFRGPEDAPLTTPARHIVK